LETSAQAERGRNGSPMMEYALAAQHHFSSQTPEADYLPATTIPLGVRLKGASPPYCAPDTAIKIIKAS